MQVCCPVEGVNRQWLNLVILQDTQAVSLYSDIDRCHFPTLPLEICRLMRFLGGVLLLATYMYKVVIQ